MTVIGRWSPNKIRKRVLDGTWAPNDGFIKGNGMALMVPTSISVSGTGSSASITSGGSVQFASCDVLSLNGVFTSTYDNYMIVMRDVASTGSVYSLRWRVSGTDNSTASSYVTQRLDIDGTTQTGSRITDTSAPFTGGSSTVRGGAIGWVYGPFLAQQTAFRSVTMTGSSSAGIFDHAGTHNQSTSYDGFTLINNLGNGTGLISVYGLEN